MKTLAAHLSVKTLQILAVSLELKRSRCKLMHLTFLQERVMSSSQFCQTALEATLTKQKWLQINAHISELKFL